MPSKRSKPAENGEASALRLLAIRDYSREEMRRKLMGKGLGTDEVEGILKRLEASRLIDDQRYARHLAALYAREKLWGPQRLLQTLQGKGIPSELAEEVNQQAEEEWPSRERLKRLLRIKIKAQGPRGMVPREKRRLADYLHRRGFPWEDIQEALEETGDLAEE